LGVITSLYEEHLDWHGSRERYVADKLRLADVSRHLLVNALQPVLLEYTASHPHRLMFGRAAGWHVADGWIRRDTRPIFQSIGSLRRERTTRSTPALHWPAGDTRHGCAVAAAGSLASFRPLPHRLQPLGERDGWHWVNDSISTTPLATLAALESLHGRAVTVLVGGHDRGLDWSPFVDAMHSMPPHAIICMGSNGVRIEAALRTVDVRCPMVRVDDLATAITEAKARTSDGGVILLSPGAPSFDQFQDYAERGRRFAELAGFDSVAITGIDGLGIG
jgi:UDP-N-acetylmuramoylalanine-D-glutamate ligase